jgi:hypothetical protein
MNRKGSKVFTDGITTSSPEVDLDGIEDGKEWESPRDAVDN